MACEPRVLTSAQQKIVHTDHILITSHFPEHALSLEEIIVLLKADYHKISAFSLYASTLRSNDLEGASLHTI